MVQMVSILCLYEFVFFMILNILCQRSSPVPHVDSSQQRDAKLVKVLRNGDQGFSPKWDICINIPPWSSGKRGWKSAGGRRLGGLLRNAVFWT